MSANKSYSKRKSFLTKDTEFDKKLAQPQKDTIGFQRRSTFKICQSVFLTVNVSLFLSVFLTINVSLFLSVCPIASFSPVFLLKFLCLLICSQSLTFLLLLIIFSFFYFPHPFWSLGWKEQKDEIKKFSFSFIVFLDSLFLFVRQTATMEWEIKCFLASIVSFIIISHQDFGSRRRAC